MTKAKRTLYMIGIVLTTAACRQGNHDTRYTVYENTGSGDESENPSADTRCGFGNGTYTAQVTCVSKTGHTYTDTPEIEVADCRLVRIYYPHNMRDENSMHPALIGSDSNALAKDTSGNAYRVHIMHGSATLTNTGKTIIGNWHMCGHTTQKGTPCRRKIRKGTYCRQHGG